MAAADLKQNQISVISGVTQETGGRPRGGRWALISGPPIVGSGGNPSPGAVNEQLSTSRALGFLTPGYYPLSRPEPCHLFRPRRLLLFARTPAPPLVCFPPDVSPRPRKECLVKCIYAEPTSPSGLLPSQFCINEKSVRSAPVVLPYSVLSPPFFSIFFYFDRSGRGST